MPIPSVNIMEPKPRSEGGTHSNSKPAMEENMGSQFLDLVAKLAKATIFPTSLLKSIRRPNTILKDQPCKSFALWWCPRLPHQGRHGGGDEP
jgi:hypothetical protein